MGIEERRKREKANKKSAITRAARRLFFDKGFKSVTVEDIARRAEISKGSVYLYFGSKEEIYTQILLNDVEKFGQKIKEILQPNVSCSDALRRFSQIYIDFFLNDRELFRILITFMLHTEDMNLSDEISNHLIKSTNENMDVVENIFREGMRSGEFSPELNIRRCRNAFWGLLNGIISLYLYIGDESRREERIRSTIGEGLEIFLRGIKNR